MLLLPADRRLLALEGYLLMRGRLVVEDVMARVVLDLHDAVVVRQSPHSGVSAHLAVDLLAIVVRALPAASEHVLSGGVGPRIDRALIRHALHAAEWTAGRQPTTQLPRRLLRAVALVKLIRRQSGRVVLRAPHVQALRYQLIAGLIGTTARVHRLADGLRIVVVQSSVKALGDESFRIISVPDASLRERSPTVSHHWLAGLFVSGVGTHAILRIERLLPLPR